MNKLTRLTALLLAMLMIFSTVATAETAYQVGGMTVENWQGIVDSAEEKLFTIEEGDSGKEVTPPPAVTPAPGEFYPYTDGTTTSLMVNGADVTRQMTASGVAVLQNAEAGQWQIQIGSTWINITGATGSELWATSAMMNGMESANFRKAFGERNAETGEYASYTNVATVEIVAEVAGAMFMMNRAAEDEGAVTPTPASVTAANDVMTIEDANPDLVKYVVTINYMLASDTRVLWDPFIAQVGEYNPTLKRTVKYPDIVGYQPGVAKLVTTTGETEILPEGFTHSSENKTMTIDATISGDLTINVYYVPAEVNYTVKYYQEKITYPANATTTDEKYDLVDTQPQRGYTESTIAEDIEADGNDATDVNGVQFYAPKDKYPGFLPLLYDDSQKIAAAGNTEVKVRYQRLYYLLSFNLGGGYGVDPVYDKFGATVDPVGTPTRAGYYFKGWTLDKNATVYVAGSYDENKLIQETDEEFPKTIPAENRIYYAVWEVHPTADIKVVFWGENADDDDYSYLETITVEDLDSLSTYIYGGGSITCGYEEHAHTDTCYTCDKVEHEHTVKDGCYELTCTASTHNHTVSGCTLECKHKHELACFTAGSDYTLRQINKPYNATTPSTNSVVTYRSYNGQTLRYALYIDGTWYSAHSYNGSFYQESNTTEITLACSHMHDDTCYTCGISEHKHTVENGCYELICEEKAHSHETCTTDCNKSVHVHTATCFTGNNANTGTNNPDTDLWVFERSDEVVVNPDGSTIVNVYWKRRTFTLTFHYNYKSSGYNQGYQSTSTITDKWGADIGDRFIAVNDTAKGNLWSTSSGGGSPWTSYLQIMPQANEDYYCSHTSTSPQSAEYYIETQTKGQYELIYTVNAYYSGGKLTISKEDFYEMEGFTYSHGTDGDGDSMPSPGKYGDFAGAKFYYTRNSYALEFYSPGALIKKDSGIPYEANLGAYDFDPDNTWIPSQYEEGSVYFDGWYQNPDCTGDEFILSEHTMPAGVKNGDTALSLYAKWTPYTYTVTVYNTPEDAAAGTPVLYEFKNVEHGKSTSSVFSYDNPNHYDQETGKFKEPVSPGNGEWQFVGWFYMKDGEETAFSFLDTRITQDTVVYAKWQMNKVVKYKVYYVLDNGDDTKGSYNIAENNWVAAPTEDSNLAGSDITVPALGGTDLYDATKSPTGINYQEGYFPKVPSQDIYIDLDETSNVFVFEYVQVDAKSYTVYYLTEENPNNNLGTETFDGKTYYKVAETLTKPENRKAVVTENYKPVSGNYLPDEFQKRLVITADSSAEDNVIFFWYTKDLKHTTLEINHYTIDYDGTTTPVGIRQEIIELPYNETVVPLTIDHYQYKAELTTRTEGGVAVNTDSPLVLNLPEGTPGVVLNLYYVEDPVTITYKVATQSLGMGTVVVGEGQPGNEASEMMGVLSGNAQGSTATAAPNYEFVGWYSEDACETLVGSDPKYVPNKVNGLNVAATYYALFREVTTTIHYIPVGPDNHELTAEEKLTIGDVAPSYETVKVVTGKTNGSTAAAVTSTYKFDGWYTDASCAPDKRVPDEWVANNKIVPVKADGEIWDATNTTYYAKFVYDVGHLSITKTVENKTDFTPTQTEFTFTVKLTGVTGDVKYWIGETEYTATKIKDGEYTLTLANGQMAMIKNILNGTEYTVTETPVTGYTTTYLKNEKKVEGYEVSGTIIPGATVNETFTNTYAVGTLEVTKTVVGTVTDAYPKTFGFTLTLSDAAALANCKIQINDGTVNAMPQDGKFTLENGQKAIITGIPQGVTYTVTEDAQVNGKNVADYFTVTAVGETMNGNVVTGMIAADTADKADFTNTAKTGSLTIKKSATGGNAGDTFLFDVTGPNNYKTTVVLTAGKEITLTELPFGEYFVKENTAWSWRYKTDDSEKSAVISAAQNGNVVISNIIDNEKWLDDEAAVVNKFTKTN